ncbi:MAG TPA: S1 RNA-binding domain-containing protein, partial [Candidatus Dormibacteraeota bacterium]|nr:S1 RNA-binding domain-containing protein [Candidatus Dormibacteraeota bacterium]
MFLREAVGMSPEHDNPESHASAVETTSAEAPTVHDNGSIVQASEETDLKAPEISETNSVVLADASANLAGQLDQSPHQAPERNQELAEDKSGDEPMEQLIDQYAIPPPTSSGGEIFEGRVIAVTDLGVVVDVGAKFEGLVPAQEFLDTGGVHFLPGDAIEVERLQEQKEGYVVLSHVRAHRRRIWEQIEKSHKEGLTLKGKVVDRIKGGLVVDIGIRAFLPASQLDLRPTHDLEAWKDREIECRVLKLNRKRGNVVVSRRVILEEEQRKQREA